MPVPTWVPGQTLASTDLNNWARPLTGYKTGSTSQTSNIILDPDPDLQVTLTATGIWVIELFLRYNGVVSNGLAFTWTVPAGAAGEFGCEQINMSGNIQLVRQPFSYTGMQLFTNGTGTEQVARLIGLLTSGPGTVQLNWAQVNSSSTPTSIDASSYLSAWRAN